MLEIIRSGQGRGGKISSIANNICSQWLKFEQRAPAAVVSMALSQPDEDGFITKGGSKGKVGKKGKRAQRAAMKMKRAYRLKKLAASQKAAAKVKEKKGKKAQARLRAATKNLKAASSPGKAHHCLLVTALVKPLPLRGLLLQHHRSEAVL